MFWYLSANLSFREPPLFRTHSTINLATFPALPLLRVVKAMINAIDKNGWGAIPGCLEINDSLRLSKECREACETGAFKPAAIGRGDTLKIREDIRRDQILWIQPGATSVEQNIYLAYLETLRMELNQRFFLGLFDFEGHFAIYPEGGFYKPHLDQHTGTSARIITVILYLNENWIPGDGGELKLWTSVGEQDGPFSLIEPRIGTLVCFPSADYWHEVLPTLKPRISITGWFRSR